ncbi:MAG: hypothetical protein J0H68_02440 [Sphingobacteriia bacterium]|nr:hypothetical protein [Sphingobacteriia bacterium]
MKIIVIPEVISTWFFVPDESITLKAANDSVVLHKPKRSIIRKFFHALFHPFKKHN